MSNDEFTLDQASALRAQMGLHSNPLAQPTRKGPPIFAIASGKGGVGKSNVAINLAYQIGNMGKRVLLFDADFGLGNTDILLGLTPEGSLAEAMTGERSLAEIAVTLPTSNVTVLPAGSGKFAAANANQIMIEALFYELERFAAGFDLILVDTGAGITQNTRDTLLASDQIIVVTTPEPTALTDSYATIKIISQRDPKKFFAVVVNMAEENEANEVYAQLAQVSKKYLDITPDFWGVIPVDKRIQAAVRKQQAISQLYPASEASLAFRRLASRILNKPVDLSKNTPSVGGFVRNFFQGATLNSARKGVAISA